LCVDGSITMLRPRTSAGLPARLGNAPTMTAGGTCPQPDVLAPLQVAPSITDTVRSKMLLTKTVLVAGSTATARGLRPTGIVAAFFAHPEGVVPLHVLPLITETVLSKVLAT